jgi:hypothetical protein
LDAPKANQAPMSRNISNSPNSPVPRETTIALPRSVPGLSSSNLRPGIPSHETSLYNPEESSAPIALGTLDGRIFDCSDSLSSAVGITKESLLNCTIFKLTHPTALQDLYCKIGNMLDSTKESENVLVVKSIFTDTTGNELYITISLLTESIEPTIDQPDQKTIKYFLFLFSRLP